MVNSVLLFDENPNTSAQSSLEQIESCNLCFRSDVELALESLEEHDFDVAVARYRAGESTCSKIIKKSNSDALSFIVLGDDSRSVDAMLEQMPTSVTDYVSAETPNCYRILRNRVRHELERKEARKEVERQKTELAERREMLSRFHGISMSSRELGDRMSDILRLGMDFLGFQMSSAVKTGTDTSVIEALEGRVDGRSKGSTVELEGSLCQEVIDKEQSVCRRSGSGGSHSVHGEQMADAYAGVPVVVSGELYGALNFWSCEVPDKSIDPNRLKAVRSMAEWIGREIASERSAERAEAREKRLRQVVDNLPQLISAKNEHGEVLLCNKAAAEVHGATVDDVEGSKQSMFDGSEGVDVPSKKDIEFAESDSSQEAEQFVIDDGSKERVFETNKIPYLPASSDKKAILRVYHEITDIEEARAELKMRSSAMEATMDGIAITDTEGKYIYMNEAHAEIFGGVPEDFMGRSWRSLYDEDEAERIETEVLSAVEDEGAWMGETTGIKMDGSQITQEITLTMMEDGKIICTNRDITDRKESEEKLREKNRRLDEFSSIVSHDLRNPLNVASGYLELSKKSMDVCDLERVEDSLNRMNHIIHELLVVSGGVENTQKERVKLSEAVEEAADSSNTDIEFEVVEDIEIEASRTGLVSMFDNMISNTVRHNCDSVRAEIGSTDDGFYYTDSGTLNAEVDEVVQHGFTTSETGRGLGVSIIKRIADLNGWRIELDRSEENSLVCSFHL